MSDPVAVAHRVHLRLSGLDLGHSRRRRGLILFRQPLDGELLEQGERSRAVREAADRLAAAMNAARPICSATGERWIVQDANADCYVLCQFGRQHQP